MLQLVEEFSLKLVFDKIPKEQLRVPATTVKKILQNVEPQFIEFRFSFLLHHDGTKDVELDMNTCGLSIVGHEKDGGIIVCRNGYRPDTSEVITYIDSFHMKKMELSTIHRHADVIMCVGCSINHDRTLLAFTKRELRKDKTPDQDHYITYYESAVTEVTGRCFTFNKITEDPQNVQFVSVPVKKNKSEQTDTICYIYQGKFGMFQITSKRTKAGANISAHPTGKDIVDQVVWYQWVPQKPLLYLIEDANRKVSASLKPNNYVLSCYSFTDKKDRPNQLFRTPISIRIGSGDKLTAVRLASGDESNIVLCKQHAHQKSCAFVQVTLCLLSHDAILDFSVVLTNELMLGEVVIYFDSIGDLLMVYIPGYYFQLINCSLDEEPKLGLCFTGPEFATALPTQPENKVVNIGPFLSEKEANSCSPTRTHNAQYQRVHTFLDKESGIVYRYRFNREAILRIFKTQQSRLLHIQALNLAVVHMQDAELVDEILIKVCGYNTENASTELFKEVLVATSYEAFVRMVSGARPCANLIPITTLSPLRDLLVKGPQQSQGVTGPMDYKQYLFSTNLKKQPKIMRQRFKYPPGDSFSHRLPSRHDSAPGVIMSTAAGLPPVCDLQKEEKLSPPPVTPDGTVGKLFARLFSMIATPEEPDVLLSPPAEKQQEKRPEDFALDPHGVRVIDALASYIFSIYGRDQKITKSQCIQLAQEYRNIQERQVNHLYKSIIAQFNEQTGDEFKLFERLCNLHCAIEELWFPYPKLFRERITSLGYKCLKKNIFLQFVERGIFEITAKFLNEQILTKPLIEEEDKKFIYLLLSKLPEEEGIKSLEMSCRGTTDQCEQTEFLLDYKMRKLKNNLKAIDMESTVHADFLPVALYLESIKSPESPDEEWKWIVTMFTNSFKLGTQ